MNTNNLIKGVTTVCDWEHDGDYSSYENALTSIDGVWITGHENHGDGQTAYIYFECIEKSIIPLLQNEELESVRIDYDYVKLLPENFTENFNMMESEDKFHPAQLTDKVDSPLSWRYCISYKAYLAKYKDKATFMKMLSELNLFPVYSYKGKSGLLFSAPPPFKTNSRPSILIMQAISAITLPIKDTLPTNYATIIF